MSRELCGTHAPTDAGWTPVWIRQESVPCSKARLHLYSPQSSTSYWQFISCYHASIWAGYTHLSKTKQFSCCIKQEKEATAIKGNKQFYPKLAPGLLCSFRDPTTAAGDTDLSDPARSPRAKSLAGRHLGCLMSQKSPFPGGIIFMKKPLTVK